MSEPDGRVPACRSQRQPQSLPWRQPGRCRMRHGIHRVWLAGHRADRDPETATGPADATRPTLTRNDRPPTSGNRHATIPSRQARPLSPRYLAGPGVSNSSELRRLHTQAEHPSGPGVPSPHSPLRTHPQTRGTGVRGTRRLAGRRGTVAADPGNRNGANPGSSNWTGGRPRQILPFPVDLPTGERTPPWNARR